MLIRNNKSTEDLRENDTCLINFMITNTRESEAVYSQMNVNNAAEFNPEAK